MTDTATVSTKPKAEKTPITMEDGRTVLFNAKQKLVKESEINGSDITVRADFRNGKTINFSVPTALLGKFAAHGAEQKLGDAIAGEDNVDDAFESMSDLVDRLNKGEWTATRTAGGFSGVSVLIQALSEFTGKTVDQVRTYLQPKSQAEKLALRRDSNIAPIVSRIESEKASKSKNAVDTGALLAGLEGLDASAPAETAPSDPAA